MASVLSVLFVLLILYARERNADTTSLACIGACAGVLAATRIDIGAFLFAFALIYLWKIAKKRILIAIGFAAIYFAALDPYIYINLYSHINEFFWQVNRNSQIVHFFGYTRWWLFFPSIGVLAAFVYVYLRPHLTSVPIDYLLWLLVLSETLCALLLFSQDHPMRYFLPLMCIWEVFLVLFALEYISLEPSFKKLRIKPEYLVVSFFALSRAMRAVIAFAAGYALGGEPRNLHSANTRAREEKLRSRLSIRLSCRRHLEWSVRKCSRETSVAFRISQKHRCGGWPVSRLVLPRG